MPKKQGIEQGDVVAHGKPHKWQTLLMQGACCLVFSACEFPSALYQGVATKESMPLRTPLAFFSSSPLDSPETDTELNLELEAIPPKSRALILNRLAGSAVTSRFQDSEQEAVATKTQHAFIAQLVEMLHLEGAAQASTVNNLKALAVQLALLGEAERYTSDSLQGPMRRLGFDNLWMKSTVGAETGLQAFDVATCLFQVSDLLLRPEG